MPVLVERLMPARPGTSCRSSDSSRSLTSCFRVLARASMLPFCCIIAPGSQPSRDAIHPIRSSALTAESEWWRTTTSSIRSRLGRQAGGSKLAAIRSRHGVERSHATADGSGGRLRVPGLRRPRVEAVPPGLRRADDGARRVEAAEALEPVDDLATPLAVQDRDQVEDAGGRVGLVLLVLLLEELPEGSLDGARGGPLRAPDTGGLEPGQSGLQRSSPSSNSSASFGPDDPAGYR